MTFSFTDGENHRRPSPGCIRGQSGYDQRRGVTAPGASGWRGKGTLDFIRVELDVLMVCVFVSLCVNVGLRLCCVGLTKLSFPLFPSSHLDVSAGPYSPVFLDGWRSQAYDSAGQPLEDPIELQHKQDALREKRQTLQKPARQEAEGAGEGTDEVWVCRPSPA